MRAERLVSYAGSMPRTAVLTAGERAERARERARKQAARKKADKIFRCGAVKRDHSACTARVSAPGARCAVHAEQDATQPAKPLLESDLRSLLAQFGVDEARRDPREVLLDTVTRAWQMVTVLDCLVRDLTADDLAVLGQQADVRLYGPFSIPTDKAKKAMYTRAVLDLHGEWVDRAARVSAMTIKAGVEERLVRLAEQQSRLIADVIREVLEGLPITAALRTRALQDVAMRLRRLSAPEPILVGAGTGKDTVHAAR